MKTRCTAAALASLMTIAGCGGGGDGEEDASQPVPATSDANASQPTAAAFAGTAYLKLRVSNKRAGQPVNMGDTMELSLCNLARQQYYELPSVLPNDDVIAQTAVSFEERYLDTDKAATYNTYYRLHLPDYQRWLDASRTSGFPFPETPPDCSVAEVRSYVKGQVWRDGVRYEVDFKNKRAAGFPSARPWSPWLLEPRERTEARDTETILSQKCYLLVGTTEGVATGEACLWDLFPNATYLNWPWSLRNHSTMADGLEYFREAVELSRDEAIDPSKFEIPDGFQIQ